MTRPLKNRVNCLSNTLKVNYIYDSTNIEQNNNHVYYTYNKYRNNDIYDNRIHMKSNNLSKAKVLCSFLTTKDLFSTTN